jgi:antiviral helicase SKI2
MLGQQSIAPKARRRRREGNESPELQVSRLGDENRQGDDSQTQDGLNGAGPSKKNVDDLLPIGVSCLVLLMLGSVKLINSDCLLLQHRESSSKRPTEKNGHMSWTSTRSSLTYASCHLNLLPEHQLTMQFNELVPEPARLVCPVR